MKKGYYIFDPISDKKELVSFKELIKTTKLTSYDLYDVVKNSLYLSGLGYILPEDTPKEGFDRILAKKYKDERWAKITIPECDYEISNYGRVRRLLPSGAKGSFLTHMYNKAENRYYVIVRINSRSVRLYLDTAVANYFLPDYKLYEPVKHLDNDTSNLYYKNIRMTTNPFYAKERWVHLNREGSNYEISDYGRVRRVLNDRYVYLQLTPKGHSKALCVHLSLLEKKGFYSVSRLVAEHFLIAFTDDLTVTFKDGDSSNVYYKNLKLTTKSEISRSSAILARKLPKVVCIEKDSGIKYGPYDSARHASRELGINRQSILDNLNRKSKLVARKYIFRYTTEIQ